ncbi:MAG: bifunctional methylenetetrahydrofolate dehydrogenase/methenyltetrahydrofolate cyclohydrolase FolD [Clostridiales bacterium]|jgi:methylenetetrahydrofolate dehydrogenase (NADP+)/methenyltetrahydrofolate cyclohydrolase|nr:bifunctional methylenetetrahydrofolate dehydrogenase/methenyltetrahydrofolate cyclohydrolase FolD [Clostridiales bacterium]
MAKIIDGKKIAAEVLTGVAKEVKALKDKGITPCLAVIIVGDNPASQVYVRNKKKDCELVGIRSLEYALPTETKQDELIGLVKQLNDDKNVHGILCQSPIPKHLDEKEVINTINPEKDVDAFHPVNVGHIMIGDCRFLPCTPAGVMEMLRHEGISAEGKSCVVIGRSNIVGKPMSILLLADNGTVTICHSRTKNLAEITKKADILVSAAGMRNLVTADMIKEGAVVIDVSMNKNDDGKLCGDVDYAEVEKVAGYITPVPGGVGPMTRAMLMKNTVTAVKNQTK